MINLDFENMNYLMKECRIKKKSKAINQPLDIRSNVKNPTQIVSSVKSILYSLEVLSDAINLI